MRTRIPLVLSTVACAVALTACQRDPSARDVPALDARARTPQVELQPGMPRPREQFRNPYEGDMQALADGRRLYHWFNCSGCHFHGGGGIGPPLMDDHWIYGSEPANVFSSVVEGRANGMPAYGRHIPEDQVWKIVAYVRSLSGLGPQLPAGASSDALQETPGEHLKTAPEPVQERLKEAQ